jgi:hypothetical protein
MPPLPGDATEAAGPLELFCAEASRAVVSFALRTPGDDHDPDCSCQHGLTIEPRIRRQTIRMGFRASYKPPVVTFRFNANVFSYKDGKKMPTTIYVDIPPHHVLSLEQTTHVDPSTAPELSPDDRQHFASGVTRVHFRLRKPGLLVGPPEELSLKPSSQRTFASFARLANTRDLILFCPHTILSKHQCQTLQQAVEPIAWTHEKWQQQATEHKNWLSTLYGGTGGRVHDTTTPTPSPSPDGGAGDAASESGESTVATATPPAYSRRAASHEDEDDSGRSAASDEAAGRLEPTVREKFKFGETSPSPPEYDSPASDVGGSAWTNDHKGKQATKRPRSSDHFDTRHRRRRLGTAEPSNDQPSKVLTKSTYLNKQHEADACTQLPASLLLSKLDQVLEQNASLKAKIDAMHDTQQEMKEKLEDLIDMDRQHVRRIEELEVEIFQLGERQDELESEQAGLAERQEDAEEKCVGIEIQVADQVQETIRERLLSALETM